MRCCARIMRMFVWSTPKQHTETHKDTSHPTTQRVQLAASSLTADVHVTPSDDIHRYRVGNTGTMFRVVKGTSLTAAAVADLSKDLGKPVTKVNPHHELTLNVAAPVNHAVVEPLAPRGRMSNIVSHATPTEQPVTTTANARSKAALDKLSAYLGKTNPDDPYGGLPMPKHCHFDPHQHLYDADPEDTPQVVAEKPKLNLRAQLREKMGNRQKPITRNQENVDPQVSSNSLFAEKHFEPKRRAYPRFGQSQAQGVAG